MKQDNLHLSYRYSIADHMHNKLSFAASFRSFGYETVYQPLYKVADTPFHIHEGDFFLLIFIHLEMNKNLDIFYKKPLACQVNLFKFSTT